MKVKELRKQYKGYDIVLFGRPLSQPTIPFTLLPKGKEIDEMEVVETNIINKEFTQFGVSFKTMKPIKPQKMKGTINVYVK